MYTITINNFIFYLGKTAKLCERHFAECCFVTESTDSNSSRTQNEQLKRRRLKPGSLPTIFPDCPSYMSLATAPERSLTTSAAHRYAREEDNLNCSIEDFFSNDKIGDFLDLKEKLKTSTTPAGFLLTDYNSSYLIYMIDGTDVPTISASFLINNDLSWTASVNQTPLPASSFPLLNDKLASVSSLPNSLATLKSFKDDNAAINWLEVSLEALTKASVTCDGDE